MTKVRFTAAQHRLIAELESAVRREQILLVRVKYLPATEHRGARYKLDRGHGTAAAVFPHDYAGGVISTLAEMLGSFLPGVNKSRLDAALTCADLHRSRYTATEVLAFVADQLRETPK